MNPYKEIRRLRDQIREMQKDHSESLCDCQYAVRLLQAELNYYKPRTQKAIDRRARAIRLANRYAFGTRTSQVLSLVVTDTDTLTVGNSGGQDAIQ